MAEAPRSAVTGEALIRGVRPTIIRYKGLSATVDMPGWYGRDPEDSVHTGADLRVSGRALAILKAKAERLLGPDDVKRVRERLGLSQREAGRLIGGGPNAFQKYESGEILVSRAVSNLLSLLDRHPEQLRELSRDVEPAA